jgi:hypothetical protein
MMGRISAATAVALLLALGLGVAQTTPAAAQDGYQGSYQQNAYQPTYYQATDQGAAYGAPEKTPWYMPQAWMYPRNTAPVIQRRPGEYGSAPRSGYAYGGFSNYCYGYCGTLPGTIATAGGVILYQPDIVMFDQRAYEIVPRLPVAAPPPQEAAVQRPAPRPTSDSVIRISSLQQEIQRSVPTGKPNFIMQNGVRIITPRPVE